MADSSSRLFCPGLTPQAPSLRPGAATGARGWLAAVLLGLTLIASGTPARCETKPAAIAAQPASAEASTAKDDAPSGAIGGQLAWTVAFGLLVLLAPAGYMMISAGLTRSKNVTHTMSMGLVAVAIAVLVYYAVGFALMYAGTAAGGGSERRELSVELLGHSWRLAGGSGFLLPAGATSIFVLALFLTQAIMAAVAAVIPTGAMAERWKFRSFVWHAVVISAIVYPLFGHWVWAGGWLAQLGAAFGLGHGVVDFAGSGVIHLTGGIAAAIGCKALGPRIGKYNRDGSTNVLLAHSVPLYMAGTLLVTLGLLALAASRAIAQDETVIGLVVVNSLLAGAAGVVAAMLFMWIKYRKPDPSFMCNGMLAGLVAISAPCAFVSPTTAVFIGLVAGVLVVCSVLWLEQRTRLDDPVGAISIHAINGAWGLLAVGLLANGQFGHGWNDAKFFREASGAITWVASGAGTVDPKWTPLGVTGLFHGHGGQFVAQLIGILVAIVWAGGVSWISLKIIGALIGNRVGPTAEYQGLDVPELGVVGYVTEDPMSPKGGATRAQAEPRAAAAPPAPGIRFGVAIEGIDAATVKVIWNQLCQPTDGAVDPDFATIYPNMTLLKGATFRFSGGLPEDIRAALERLFTKQLPGKTIRTRVETQSTPPAT